MQHTTDKRNRKPGGRELWVGLAVIAVTIVPFAVGALFGVYSFVWWGALSSYLGLSWLVPGAALGVAGARHAWLLGARHPDAIGVAVGVLATIVLLVIDGVLLVAAGPSWSS